MSLVSSIYQNPNNAERAYDVSASRHENRKRDRQSQNRPALTNGAIHHELNIAINGLREIYKHSDPIGRDFCTKLAKRLKELTNRLGNGAAHPRKARK